MTRDAKDREKRDEGAKKLRIKKETIKDLDTKGKAGDVKGGAIRCTKEGTGCEIY